MLPQVDSGKVVAVHRFPLLQEDSVLSLTKRCYSAIAQLYSEILLDIVQGRPLPQSGETWTRQPYTLKDFFELCRLTLDMDVEEQRRRIRATQFRGAMVRISISMVGDSCLKVRKRCLASTPSGPDLRVLSITVTFPRRK